MNRPKSSNTLGRPGRSANITSLDDLVEESQTNNGSQSREDNNNEDGSEDELEAYMASIDCKSNHHSKKIKHDDKTELVSTEEVDDQPIFEEPAVEDLKADVEAAIAGANNPANKTLKRLNQLGDRQITYIPFKKNFYQEVPDLACMTKEEVDELRISLENIKVVGKSCPKPVTCWAHCGLSKKVMEVLKKLNFSSPTPIQAQAIPAIMSGRDVIGIAKTGCGKTLSFLLPMFRHILAQPKLAKGDGAIAIVMTPTRELATQICDDAQKFTKVLGLRVVPVYGGPNISEQIGMLKHGAEIIVCTPGRMIEILTVNSGRVTNLNRCTFLVLDEADRLFDMGFEKQIRSIVNLVRPDRQTVMFSATFPKMLEAHARKILTDPVAIQVGGRSVVCKDVEQAIEIVEEDDKFLRLLPILQRHVDSENSAIVFVSKQGKADSLLEDLMQAYDPNCLVLHGGIDKDDRISTFASFKKGQAKVLVATSVAARGLDVKNCICVINYDCPNHYEDYVHRCGRTGRAGRKGYAYTFITPDQGHYAADIIKAFELSEKPVPKDIQDLWNNYKAEAEKLGKKIWSSSGFSGRGFKFDEAETQLVNEKKKHQKKSLGMQNSSDEEDEGGEVDHNMDTATLESTLKSLSGSKEVAKPVIKVFGSSSKAEPTKQISQTKTDAGLKNEVQSKLDLARQRAALLCKKKGIETVVPAPSTADAAHSSAFATEQSVDARSRSGVPSSTPLIEAHSAESTDVPIVTTISTGKERLELQMEINQYNQQVRRRLTSKDALNRVSEHCEVGITVRGQFCQPGDRAIEPKLYLAIEGTSQANLEKAHRELMLLVIDEYNRTNSQPAKGRFRII